MPNTPIKQKAQLGDFISVLTDYHANGAYKKLKENVELLDVPDYAVMIRTTNFEKEDLTDDLKYISEDAYNFLKKSKVKPGDILMNKIAKPGSVYLMPDLKRPVSLAMNLFLIRVNQEEINQTYVYYWLKTNEAYVKSFANGAAAQTITKQAVKELKIDVLPRNSQDRAVEILNTYQNLIENNNRRIAILEDMAQSLYREWFVKFRFPGHQNTKFKESLLGAIPEGWEIVPLEEICERVTDGAHKSPLSINDGVPMASVKDMHDFGFNISTCRHISEEDYLDLVRQDSVVKQNDILVAKDGSYLKHTFVVEKDLKVALLSSIAMLRPNEKVKTHWLAYTLKSNIVKERMKQCVSGVAIPRIILKDFRKFKIISPPIDLQNKWNDAAQGMIEQCWNLVERNNNLKKQRDLLLPKLISGNIGIEG